MEVAPNKEEELKVMEGLPLHHLDDRTPLNVLFIHYSMQGTPRHQDLYTVKVQL